MSKICINSLDDSVFQIVFQHVVAICPYFICRPGEYNKPKPPPPVSRKAGEPRPVSAREVSEDRWHLRDVVLPLPRPGAPVPESGGRLSMEAIQRAEKRFLK